VKKVCGPQEGHSEKRCDIQGGGQEMAVMVSNSKNFNNDNSGEFGAKSYTNLLELLLLNFLLSTYHHSHFLTATLDFTSFFTMAFLGATHFFYSWAVFGLDNYFMN